MPTTKGDIIKKLQQELLLLQGFKASVNLATDFSLGPILTSFPNGIFPTAAIHEFISIGPESCACSCGFVSSLAAALMGTGGAGIWIDTNGRVFPAGLKAFGIDPGKVVFIRMKTEKEVLWALEEALKCEGIAAVVGEIRNIDLTASRRLQLAVEKSQVTGFLLRNNPKSIVPNASIARWRITPLPSLLAAPGMPGVGYPQWSVELLKAKNGKPGKWQVEWSAGRYRVVSPDRPSIRLDQVRKTG